MTNFPVKDKVIAKALGIAPTSLSRALKRDGEDYLNEMRIFQVYNYLKNEEKDEKSARKIANAADIKYPGMSSLLLKSSSPYTNSLISSIGEAQEYVNQVLAEDSSLDIWLIGLSSLPVLESDSVKSKWIENLNRGINYRLIWFIDEIDITAFERMAKVLKSIEVELTESSGLIYHYSTYIHSKNIESTSSCMQEEYYFRKLKETKYKHNKFMSIDADCEEYKNIRSELSISWQKHSTLGVYIPSSLEFSPKANIRLLNIKFSMKDSNVQSPMFWLSDNDAYDLVRIVGAIERCKEQNYEK